MENAESQSLNSASKSILKFTSVLCKKFAKSIKENYICSPLSAHVVLSMAAYGADENTAIEMRKVLHMPDDDSKLLDDYQKVIDTLQTDENLEHDREEKEYFEERINVFLEDESLTEVQRDKYIRDYREQLEESILHCKKRECIVTLANKIFMSEKITLKEHYDNALHTYFRSKSQILDFEKKVEAAEIINKWCHENTNGKISHIVSPGEFNKASALYLMNAVYFKGKWAQDFKPAIPKMYHLGILKKIKVPTMYMKTKLDYRNLPELNAKAVRLDFMRCEKYMEIIVPNRINGLEYIAKNLKKISDKEFKNVRIRLWLPKFEIRSEIKFVEYLMNMGMIEAFDEEKSNFNKICDKEVFIKSVIQKAYIKVDERGCEAAAVTGVGIAMKLCAKKRRIKPRYMTIKANRPFLFRIMDSRLNIPLFIGSVVNPKEATSQ